MAKGFKVQVRGLNKVRKRLGQHGKAGINAFRGAMYVEGLSIIGKATEKAPAVTGRLRNSHFVTHPDLRGNVTIGFGVKYAAAVDAGLRVIDMARKQQRAAFASMRDTGWKKSRVGGPRYFSNAIQGAKIGIVHRVAKTAWRYFKAGIGFTPSGDMPNKPKSK